MNKIIQNFFKTGRFFNLLDGSKKVISPKNTISPDRQEATIYMYEEISEWWGLSANWLRLTLDEMRDIPLIHLRINCPGGEIFEAAAMQKILAEHPAQIWAHIDCLAASAMSFMIRGANKRIISDMGFIMIHRAMSGISGNGDELISWGEALKIMDNTLAESYVKSTSASKEDVVSWMEKETWFSAEKALEYGFVDEISEAEPVDNIFDLSVYDNFPGTIRNKQINIDIDKVDVFNDGTKDRNRQIDLVRFGL